MSTNTINRPILPPNTIVPESDDLFVPYLNHLYEEIAYNVNARDYSFYTIPITSIATNIPNIPNFGAFLICVSGTTNGLPTITASLCKADVSSAGSVIPLGSQAGTIGIWAGSNLTITSTATNFQIKHDSSGNAGNFNIRIIGTQ